jgi:hypothetical protein
MCAAASAAAEQDAKNLRKNAKQRNKAFAKQGTDSIIAAHFERRMGRYPSGQRGQTVNLLAYAYAGSNPALPTTFILSELKTKAPPQRRGFFFECSQFVATFSIQFGSPHLHPVGEQKINCHSVTMEWATRCVKAAIPRSSAL